jgi:hypothetical protein
MEAAFDPELEAARAVGRPEAIRRLLDGLSARPARVKFGSAKALVLVSEKSPRLLYAHFDEIARLLEGPNEILCWNAIRILAQLASVDEAGKLEQILDAYYAPISGPSLVTAANLIASAPAIVKAKPWLADRIAEKICRVGRARYKTPECRNVALTHAIQSLDRIFPCLSAGQPALRFVRRHTRNSRSSTRKAAEMFLQHHAPAQRPRTR